MAIKRANKSPFCLVGESTEPRHSRRFDRN
jgi:hypothetical protein